MKKTVATLLIAGSVLTLSAADINIGAGVALTSDGSSVKIPIDISETLRVEPEVSFGYSSYKDNSDSEFGLLAGVYLMSQPSENINLYYGGKVGFVVASTTTKYDTDFGGSSTKTNSANSFALIPTAGFEYFIDPSVSIGGEAGFALGFGDVTTVGLTTQTSLRYYF